MQLPSDMTCVCDCQPATFTDQYVARTVGPTNYANYPFGYCWEQCSNARSLRGEPVSDCVVYISTETLSMTILILKYFPFTPIPQKLEYHTRISIIQINTVARLSPRSQTIGKWWFSNLDRAETIRLIEIKFRMLDCIAEFSRHSSVIGHWL